MADRNKRGQFVPGNTVGKGPRLRKSRAYVDAIRKAATPAKIAKIVGKLIEALTQLLP